MKRIISISFLLTYLFVISGIVLCFNYCGDTVSSVNLGFAKTQKENICPCGAKKVMHSCCHSAKIAAKVTDTNKTPSYTYSFKVPVAKLLALLPNSLKSIAAHITSLQLSYPFVNAPLDGQSNNLFLLNCTFRI